MTQFSSRGDSLCPSPWRESGEPGLGHLCCLTFNLSPASPRGPAGLVTQVSRPCPAPSPAWWGQLGAVSALQCQQGFCSFSVSKDELGDVLGASCPLGRWVAGLGTRRCWLSGIAAGGAGEDPSVRVSSSSGCPPSWARGSVPKSLWPLISVVTCAPLAAPSVSPL